MQSNIGWLSWKYMLKLNNGWSFELLLLAKIIKQLWLKQPESKTTNCVLVQLSDNVFS